MWRAPSRTVIEIIYHGNITSNIAAGILVRRRFITERIERAILKRMFRANLGIYFLLRLVKRIIWRRAALEILCMPH